MYQEGRVSIVKCKTCMDSFPVFTFVADTDMLTSGCVALSAKGNKIILTMQATNETDSEVENRIGSNYKMVPVRYLDNGPSPVGMSFQEFRKVYRPRKAVYSCLSCGSDSEIVKTETKEQFLTYGKIEVTNYS